MMRSDDEFTTWALARIAGLEAELEAALARDAPLCEQAAILGKMDDHYWQIHQRLEQMLAAFAARQRQ